MSRTLPRPMRGRVLILDSYKSIYAACFSSSARHFPCAARPFMCARWKNAFCAAPTLPGCPRQVFSAAFCSARERSEEHTSELQSHSDLVCRLLLEKKKTHT